MGLAPTIRTIYSPTKRYFIVLFLTATWKAAVADQAPRTTIIQRATMPQPLALPCSTNGMPKTSFANCRATRSSNRENLRDASKDRKVGTCKGSVRTLQSPRHTLNKSLSALRLTSPVLNLCKLPSEIVCYIYSLLSASSVLALSYTCKRLRLISPLQIEDLFSRDVMRSREEVITMKKEGSIWLSLFERDKPRYRFVTSYQKCPICQQAQRISRFSITALRSPDRRNIKCISCEGVFWICSRKVWNYDQVSDLAKNSLYYPSLVKTGDQRAWGCGKHFLWFEEGELKQWYPVALAESLSFSRHKKLVCFTRDESFMSNLNIPVCSHSTIRDLLWDGKLSKDWGRCIQQDYYYHYHGCNARNFILRHRPIGNGKTLIYLETSTDMSPYWLEKSMILQSEVDSLNNVWESREVSPETMSAIEDAAFHHLNQLHSEVTLPNRQWTHLDST